MLKVPLFFNKLKVFMFMFKKVRHKLVWWQKVPAPLTPHEETSAQKMIVWRCRNYFWFKIVSSASLASVFKCYICSLLFVALKKWLPASEEMTEILQSSWISTHVAWTTTHTHTHTPETSRVLVSLQGLMHPNETEVLYFRWEMISGAESVVLDGVGTVPPGGYRGRSSCIWFERLFISSWSKDLPAGVI